MKKLIFVFFCILTISQISGNEVTRKLDERMKSVDSLACVGLDPDLSKMPLTITSLNLPCEEKVYLFLTQVVEITSPHVCCYKIQKAFFDQFDHGHCLLRRICQYVHEKYPDIPVFIDCKIGDIDNTMIAYMNLIFKDFSADGVVVNPYMGDDVLEPFLNDEKKQRLYYFKQATLMQKLFKNYV